MTTSPSNVGLAPTTDSILGNHPEHGSLHLVGAGGVEIVPTALDEHQVPLGRVGKQAQVLRAQLDAEHDVPGALQPVHGADDVAQAPQQAVALHQVDQRHLEHPPPAVAAVHGPQRVAPELQRLGPHRPREPQAAHRRAPRLVHHKVRRAVRRRPRLQERGQRCAGIPAALGPGVCRLAVHRRA
ncbi:hypothetical protein ACKVWC_011611 [Pyricularia oryzae]